MSLDMRLRMVTNILSKAVWPRNRQALETGRKALWGTGLAPHKAGLFDPFDQVYVLLVDVMTTVYSRFGEDGSNEFDPIHDIFSAALDFLEKAPLSLLLTGLRRTQDGFAMWIRDEARKTAADPAVSETITSAWSTLLRLIKVLPSADGNVLKTLETLLVAGFVSPHKQFVNDTIVFWNDKFGGQDSLEYPVRLESVLRAHNLDADIDLPTFPDSNTETVTATLPEFFESQSEATVKPVTRTSADTKMKGDKHAPKAQSVYFTATKSPAANANVMPNTIDRRSNASGSSTPKARLRHDDSQIQFAPIDSSPIRPPDDSQHLTEHQKEVMVRQTEAAQMFPELSSSPMAQSTALPRALPKRLDFSSEANGQEDEDPGTPTALPDAAGLMSDDIPSSPTPSSTKGASQVPLDAIDEQASEDELDEPPSSPPRSVDDEELVAQPKNRIQHAVGPDDTTVDITDFAGTGQVDTSGGYHAGQLKPESVTRAHEEPSDILSDSYLPAEQLQMEAEAAEQVAGTEEVPEESNDERNDSSTTKQLNPDTAQEGQDKALTADNVTRVEDSFIGVSKDEDGEEESVEGSQSYRRSNRKRKQSFTGPSPSKKQKRASPFKRILSTLWRGSQQEDDDIGDEIVVASSQRSHSPTSPGDQPSQPVGEPNTDVKPEIMPPPKRRPGRPRKSETPTPSVSQGSEEALQTRSRKRRASSISNAGATETEPTTSFVKDTPAPSKSRKGRQGQTPSQATSPSQTDRVTRRTATAVVVQRPSQEELDDAPQHDGSSIGVATPPKHETESQTDASDERPKLTPRSILGRLRDALTDFMGMKVSASEAREFDDVLYEFRREVHEADRRGRINGGE